MKNKIKKLLILFTKVIYIFFYKKEYLKGKYFDKSDDGWFWVLKGIWFQKILGFNRFIPWPVSHNCLISNYKNLVFHFDSMNNFQSPGCYFQNFNGKIFICKNVFIAPNVGLITANHDLNDLSKHLKGKNIVIGSNSWIGMNSVLLPGVRLGPNTIVGAGSIVTKSFREGNIIIAGNPAKIIKRLNND